MLQGNCRAQRAPRRALARVVLVAGWTCIVTIGAGLSADTAPADSPTTPLSVCEVLRDLSGMDGKNAAVLGRYSFRPDGRWVSEQSCDPPAPAPAELWLVEDATEAPKLPEPFELDSVALHKKLAQIERHTALAKFRFGTPGYDRWAVVYGRVEVRKGDDTKKAPANLLFRGSGVVVFVPE